MLVPAPSPALERRDVWIAAVLAVAVLGLYARTVGFEFVGWDDPQYVSGNRAIRDGLSLRGIAWAFTTDRMGSWHPLTWLSHMLDVELFGLAPAGHHGSNVVLHALNTLLVYFVLRALTGARWRSALVGALFGVHPLHVESVAWVAERKDLLSTFFVLLALGAYVAHARRPALRRYLLVAGCLALSLMSKPMFVTLPLILLLLDVWPLRRPLRPALLLEKVPLLVLSAACAGLTLSTQSQSAVLLLWQRLANALLSYVVYLAKLLWPVQLGMFYPHPYLPESGASAPAAWQIVGAAALLLGITACALAARRQRYLAVGWLWYAISLVPVIGIVQVGRQALADRYSYFPSIGIFVALVWGGAELVAYLGRRVPAIPSAAGAVAVLSLVALSAATWHQIGTWRDSLTLYEHALSVAPRNPVIRYNLANELMRRGRNSEAIAEFRRSLEDAPSDAGIHVNLANALRAEGDPEAAMHHYLAALDRKPDDAMAHINLGSLLRERGRLDEAEAHYRHALRISPQPTFTFNLANLLRERGELDAAIELYQQVLLRQPLNARAHNNLGSTLLERGDPEPALRHFRRACELDPSNPRAQRNAGRTSKQLGRLDDAAEHLRRALDLQPDDETRALLAEIEAARPPVDETGGSPAP